MRRPRGSEPSYRFLGGLLLSTGGVILALLLLIAFSAAAQVSDPKALSLSEVSLPVGAGSKSVHEGSSTLREGSVGSMKSRPVHDGTSRSMKSGPLSDISRGPVSERRSMSGARSMFEASSGAVTKDTASPLGERISAPISELVDLQQALRQRALGGPSDIAEVVPGEDLPSTGWRAPAEFEQDFAGADDEGLAAGTHEADGVQVEEVEGIWDQGEEVEGVWDQQEIDGVWADDEPSASE